MNLRERLKEKGDELARLCDGDYHELLIALHVAGIFRMTMALCGDDLSKELGRQWTMDARQRCGLCQDCDTEINPVITHPPLCEHCGAKNAAECKRIDEMMGEYEGDVP